MKDACHARACGVETAVRGAASSRGPVPSAHAAFTAATRSTTTGTGWRERLAPSQVAAYLYLEPLVTRRRRGAA